MKLYFSVSPVPTEDHRETLLAVVTDTVPGSTARFSEDGKRLALEVPSQSDRFAVLDAVTFRIKAFGYTVTEESRQDPPAPPITNFGSFYQEKQPRTVRLSTFLITLISVALAVSVLGVLLGSALSGVFGFRHGDTLGVDGTEDYSEKIGLIDTIFRDYALYDTNGDLLLDSMLKAYVEATGDQYAAYYTAAEFAELMTQNSGSLVGVGITVIESVDPKGIAIIGVVPNSPADQAGVKPGDVIVSIGSGENAFSVAERGYEASLNALRGDEGSVAHFKVVRETESLDFSISRAKVETLSVTGKVSETNAAIGIVSISQFATNTPVQFKNEMDRLIGLGCTKFVFDVRNNPGGDLKSIVAVLSYFLNENDLVVTIVQKDGTSESEYVKAVTYEGTYADCSVAKEDIGKYRNYAKAVLINGYTASAAELFSAVLRDYQLATLVGTTTYGKGVLQNIFDLSVFGYSGGLKLTTGYYNPPSGENYDGKGVAPHGAETPLDDAVKDKNPALLSEAQDNQIAAAIAAITQ